MLVQYVALVILWGKAAEEPRWHGNTPKP